MPSLKDSNCAPFVRFHRNVLILKKRTLSFSAASSLGRITAAKESMTLKDKGFKRWRCGFEFEVVDETAFDRNESE